MQRRSFLALGAGAAAVLALGGGAAALLQPGITGARLSAAGREVFANAARGLLEGSLPPGGRERELALDGLVERVDTLVAGLPPHAQAELSQLLALLASTPGRRAFSGLPAPWPEASVAQLEAALEGMRASALSLRRQAYHALHDIVSGAYFSDPSTWTSLGYPGPVAV